MNADGTGQTRLTNKPASDAYPTFSPDSSKIAFDSNRDGNDEIYSMNADGSGQTRLTNAAGVDSYPDWGGSVIDSTPPETTIDSGPSGPTSNSTPTFAFHSSEAGSSFACSIDTARRASAPARVPVPPTLPRPRSPTAPTPSGCGPRTPPTTPIPPPTRAASPSTPRLPAYPA